MTMIIKCRKCGTSFRFDDQLMSGEGVWVRCGRCRDVFFQDNPIPEDRLSGPPAASQISPPGQEANAEPAFRPAAVAAKEKENEDAWDAGSVEMEEPILTRVREIREAMEAEAEAEAEAEGSSLLYKEVHDREIPLAAANESNEIEKLPEPPTAEVTEKTRSLGRFFAYFFLVLLVAVLAGGAYLWVFPESRKQVADVIATYLPVTGVMEKLNLQDPVLGQVSLQDVRQHIVNNWLMGSLRVVEGTAVNTGNFPLTRLQVRGRGYDSAGAVLGESVSFCGNLLTDAELTTLTEEEMQRRLSQTSGSNVANDRISPQDQIPFMVVIASQDQQAVAKTTVMVAGAEKLLE